MYTRQKLQRLQDPLTNAPKLQEMMAGSLWAVLVMCLLVMPLAWCLLPLAPRYTAPTNVSLLMLLEKVLGPFWVWLGTGERPSPMMPVREAIVLVTLATSYIIATARAEVRLRDQTES